jgi:hypothetical protein
MIGNKIKFAEYTYSGSTHTREEHEGLVVDAWTDVSGTVSGKTDVFLGFGEGKVSGRTQSNRMYKVQTKYGSFKDIRAGMISEIVEFAKLIVIDEKIIQQTK